MMGHREPFTNGDEKDYLTKTRRYFKKRPGKFSRVKRAYNKRVRKAAKAALHLC